MTKNTDEIRPSEVLTSTYAVDAKLPSCKVSRKSLAELEGYLVRQVSEISRLPNPTVEVVITEGRRATEKLESVNKFDQDIFQSKTESIELRCSADGSTPLNINIKFHRAKLYSRILVSHSGPSSRVKVDGLVQQILKFLETSKNNNYIFRSLIYNILLTGVLGIACVLFVRAYQAASNSDLILPMALLGTGMCGLSLRFIKPYTAFDTPRDSKFESATRLVFVALLGFLIVSLLTPLREHILGY